MVNILEQHEEYIPIKFAEIILDSVLKPQMDNTEAVKELTRSINELVKLVSAPPSNHQLQEYILENREILLNKIDKYIADIEKEMEKEHNEKENFKREALEEIKKLFETNRKMIEKQMTDFDDWCEIKEKENGELKDTIHSNISIESPLNQNIKKLLYWNKIVLTSISIAFTIIMAGITFISLVLK